MTRKDMDDFKTRFNRALETVADKPVLETLHLSAGHSSYQKVANESFARVNGMEDPAHLERVKSHWWHDDKNAIVPSIRWVDHSRCRQVAAGVLFHDLEEFQPSPVERGQRHGSNATTS